MRAENSIWVNKRFIRQFIEADLAADHPCKARVSGLTISLLKN